MNLKDLLLLILLIWVGFNQIQISNLSNMIAVLSETDKANHDYITHVKRVVMELLDIVSKRGKENE
ncbi:hypothetical protein NHG29_01775 [Aerococcaceae bacterium NML160702]|nr:hypothetical protein [Aerococcaceae bacterium NML160702]